MIDDREQVRQLLLSLQGHLPIPARPSPELVRAMDGTDVAIRPEDELLVCALLYLGDQGGVACELQVPRLGEDRVVTSITHLRFDNSHPVAEQIEAYQAHRSQRLAEWNSNPDALPGSASTTSKRAARRRRSPASDRRSGSRRKPR